MRGESTVRAILWATAALLAACAGSAGGRGAASASAPGGPRVEYTVAVEGDLAHARVTVCFPGEVPAALAPFHPDGRGLVSEVRSSTGALLPHAGDGVDLSSLAPGACAAYRAPLDGAGWPLRRRVSGADFVGKHGVWLWAPRPLPAAPDATLRFELPPGIHVAAPWPREGDAFRLRRGAFQRATHVALGRFDTRSFTLGRTRFDVSTLEGRLDIGEEGVVAFVRRAAEATSTLVGGFPYARVQVLVVPVGPGGEGLAFGEAYRGGGASLVLYVHSGATPEALGRDWVAVHELSHLTTPFLGGEAAWLGEGLATYFQEVVRARSGMQDPRRSWRELARGFGRGGAATPPGAPPLEEASRAMHRTRGYMRVYWSGAAWALELDLALRERSSGREGLDALVARAFPDVDAGPERLGSAAFADRLDEALGAAVARPLHDRYVARRDFPDAALLLARIGVLVGPDGEVELDDAAPLAAARDAIMAPAPALESRLAARPGAWTPGPPRRTLPPSAAPGAVRRAPSGRRGREPAPRSGPRSATWTT